MSRFWLLPLCGLVVAVSPRLVAGFHDALTATQLLRNIGIESAFVAKLQPVNGSAPAAEARFSAVFDFDDIVWSYAPESGTSILGASPTGEREYLAALGVLLARTVPPHTSIKLYRHAGLIDDAALGQRSIANACVIGCLLALAQQIVDHGSPDEAGLVLFGFGAAETFDPGAVRVVDHSVLVYRVNEEWACIDPLKSNDALPLEHVVVGQGVDPVLLAVSQRLHRPLQRAYYLPLSHKTLKRIQWRIERPQPAPG